jgi:hypothetical protein
MKNFRSFIASRLLPVVLVLLLIDGTITAQETGSCAEKLKSAQTSFAKGQTEVVPSLLNECLKTGGFKREEELAAYKLLIQTYLLNDKLEQADSTMLAFLRSNPEYKTSPTDHSSFVYLYNTYEVKSLFMLSFRVGTNYPFLTFVTEHPTSMEPGGDSKFSSDLANLFLSLEAKYRVSKRIELGLGAGFSQMKFSNVVKGYSFGDITYTETQMRIEIPVCMTYDLTIDNKFTPFIRAGLGGALNLSTNADAVFINDPGTKQSNITGETLQRKDSRAPVDFFVQAGGGIKYKIPRGFVFAEVRSNIGLMQQYVSGGSTVDILQNKYKWSDPEFMFNSLNMNVGITIIFYKPSKKADLK